MYKGKRLTVIARLLCFFLVFCVSHGVCLEHTLIFFSVSRSLFFSFYVLCLVMMIKVLYLQDLPRSNVLYGYRIDGPHGWDQGHRFDSSNVLIDPYAKLVEGRRYFGDSKDKLSGFLGTYDFDSSPFYWGDNYKLPNIPEVNTFPHLVVMH